MSSPHSPLRIWDTIGLAAVGAAAGAFLTWIVTVQLLNEPVADDYSWLHYERIFGVWGFFTWFLTGLTGRYSNAALMAVSIEVFGDRAVQLVPLLLLLALCLACVVLALQLVRALRPADSRSQQWVRAVPLGLLVPAAAAACLPSVYDSLVWYNSVCIFLASLTGMAWLAVLWLRPHLRPGGVVRWPYLVGLAALTYVVQGFAESTSAIVVGVAALALVAGIFWPYWRRRLLPNAVVFVVGVLGILTVLLLPGTRARTGIQDDLFPENTVGKVLRGTLHTLEIPLDIVTTWRLAVVVLLGVALWLVFGRDLLRRPVTTLIAGAALAIGPVAATGFVTYLTVQAEPYRTQTVSVVLSVVGMALLVALALALVASRVALPAAVPGVVTAVAAVLAVAVSAPAFSSIVQAVSLRSSMVDFRAVSVSAQRDAGDPVIIVDPAPLLLHTSDVVEFGYGDVEVDWFERGFSQYYGIEDREVVRDLAQPAGYCLATDYSAFPNGASLAVYFGARSCAELALLGAQ